MSILERDPIDVLPEDVEAYLAEEGGVEQPEQRDAPTVDLSLALRLMRRLGRIRRNAQQHTAALRAEAERIERAIAEVEAIAERRAQPIEDLLRLFHRGVLAEDAKAKTVSLAPYGELKARSVGQTVKLVDRDEALGWADESAPEFVKHKPDLDWARLKECLHVMPDGRVICTTTGEVVRGVEAVEARTEFSVKPSEVK